MNCEWAVCTHPPGGPWFKGVGPVPKLEWEDLRIDFLQFLKLKRTEFRKQTFTGEEVEKMLILHRYLDAGSVSDWLAMWIVALANEIPDREGRANIEPARKATARERLITHD